MNKSIFHTFVKNNNINIKIMDKCSYNNIFNSVVNIKLNKLDELQIRSSGSEVFKEFNGQVGHFKAEFENIGNKSNEIYKTYLSCDTTKPNNSFYEYIGKIKHKGEIEDQFINFKHILTFDKSSSRIIEYNNYHKVLEKANEISSLLKQSNKIPMIEEKLNFIQNSFENCIKHSHKISDCYHILSINSYKISNGIFDIILTYNLV